MTKSQFIAIAVLFVGLLSLPAHAGDNKVGKCPAFKLCLQLLTSMNECKTGMDSEHCDAFVSTMRQLSPSLDCKRSFDTQPVPAIWMCKEVISRMGEEAMGDSYTLLKSLKVPSAAEYYKSKEFQSTLDGEYSEDYKRLGLGD